MKTIKLAVMGAALSLGFAGTVSASDTLILTGEKAGNGTAVALDFSSSGNATAVEFRIAVAEGESAKVNLRNCLQSLPKTHGGQCTFAKGQVIGLVFSDSNELLPAGMLSFGSVGIGTKVQPSLTLLTVVDAKGEKLQTSVELGSDAIENKTGAQ
jgi:hypothetical protein